MAANTTSIATQNVDKVSLSSSLSNNLCLSLKLSVSMYISLSLAVVQDSTSAVEKTPSTSTISLDLYRQFFR